MQLTTLCTYQHMQALQLRLQKPTLVLDLAFLMPLAAFFSSSSEPSSDEAHGVTLRSAMRREVLLGREVHLAQVCELLHTR